MSDKGKLIIINYLCDRAYEKAEEGCDLLYNFIEKIKKGDVIDDEGWLLIVDYFHNFMLKTERIQEVIEDKSDE